MTPSGQSSPLYFGCWRSVGHHFHLSGGADAGRYDVVKATLPWDKIDGALAPKAPAKLGEAALHHKGGWTALAWWDRSVDTRGGSNSVVFLPGTLTFDEALAAAHEHFPHVMERQRFEVRPVAARAEA